LVAMRKGSIVLIAALAISLIVPAAVHAIRKPTAKEKAQIASVVHLPTICAKVRISTVTKKPKWGKVSFKPGPAICEPLASNGVTVVRKSSGRWHFVTAGSSFTCSELYAQVPKPIAKDLRIDCTAGAT
jgi:hypothetical protein